MGRPIGSKNRPKPPKGPEPQSDQVVDIINDIYGEDVPKNPDGTVQSEAMVETKDLQKAGAAQEESVIRNRIAHKNIARARQGQHVRWNETDALALFDIIKKTWPTGIRIYISRIEPTAEAYRPVDLSSYREAKNLYDYILQYIHKRSPAAVYKLAFRDHVDRGSATLSLPSTLEEVDMQRGMSGMPGMPFPPAPPYGYPGGYAPLGYPPPQGIPGAPGYPPQTYPGYPVPSGPVPPPPPLTPFGAPTPPPATAEPIQVAPLAPAPVAPPQPSYDPRFPQGYGPPAPTDIQQQMATNFWQTQEQAVALRQLSERFNHLLGIIEGKMQVAAPAPPAPAPVQQPAHQGFANMPPAQGLGMPPGAPMPAAYQPMQQPFQQASQAALPPQNTLQTAQQQIAQAAQLLSELTKMKTNILRAAGGESIEINNAGEIQEPDLSPTADEPPPFRTMPLGKEMQWAYNPQDGSPHWFGTVMANAPLLMGWVERVGNRFSQMMQQQQAILQHQQFVQNGAITVPPSGVIDRATTEGGHVQSAPPSPPRAFTPPPGFV